MRALVDGPTAGVAIEAIVEGAGPDVVLLPSAGRGAGDFADLQRRLTHAGFRSIAVNPRGAGASRGPTRGEPFRTAVDDVAAVVARLASGPVHVVGHGLGNTIARALASFHPALVRKVVAMPVGGHNASRFPPAPEVMVHFHRCHDPKLPRAERTESLRAAFFAPGHDASVWLDGWHPDAAWIAPAMQASDPEGWWRGGTAPILILQPLDDAMAPPAAGRETAQALGERASYVEIARCGHAILPEQPAPVAEAIRGFLRTG